MITACSNKNVFDSYYYCKKLKFDCIRDDQMVLFKTSKGDLEVKLNGENYPLTVTNFVENIRKNIYTNQRFYKIINYHEIKVIHGGIYKDKNRILYDLPVSIPLEIALKNNLEPNYKYSIENYYEIEDVKNFFQRGSLAMVKSGERNSSSTEFFFVTNKIPELDGRYSIFGKIVSGFDVLEKIDKTDILYEIKLYN